MTIEVNSETSSKMKISTSLMPVFFALDDFGLKIVEARIFPIRQITKWTREGNKALFVSPTKFQFGKYFM